jgi:hypothetical protein
VRADLAGASLQPMGLTGHHSKSSTGRAVSSAQPHNPPGANYDAGARAIWAGAGWVDRQLDISPGAWRRGAPQAARASTPGAVSGVVVRRVPEPRPVIRIVPEDDQRVGFTGESPETFERPLGLIA